MMQKKFAVLLFGLVSLAAPISAASTGALGDAERAEHAQWERDTARWVAEHEYVADRLAILAAQLRHSEDVLARYETDIERHADRLQRGDESGALLTAHMKMRSAHEDMRITHAQLMAALSSLEAAVQADDDSGIREPVE